MAGQKSALRCDFNVPLNKNTGAITDERAYHSCSSNNQIQYWNRSSCNRLLPFGQCLRDKGARFSMKVVASKASRLLCQTSCLSKDEIARMHQLASALMGGEIMRESMKTIVITKRRKKRAGICKKTGNHGGSLCRRMHS